MEYIDLKQVGTNNLKVHSLSLPIGRLSVVTGVSGSGKSSLVFDTLYAEAYRRYVESLSSFARQYLKALPKPTIESVENLPPAIAVRQARSTGTSRSTVGTMTEIADLLRVVYTYFSVIICPNCNTEVKEDSAESIAKEITDAHLGEQVTVIAPLFRLEKIKAKDLKVQLAQQGFTRCVVKGEVKRLDDLKDVDLKEASVVVDRLTVTSEDFRRLAESSELALKIGRQQMAVLIGDTVKKFSSYLGCSTCERRFSRPTLAMFSFNHPFGACPVCQGFGAESAIDWDKVFPDKDSSIAEKGVVPWNWGQHTVCYKEAAGPAKAFGLSFSKKFSAYNAKDWQWLKFGDGKKYGGVKSYFDWLDSHRHKAHYRIHAARFRKYVICSGCHGGRLNHDALACRVEGLNIAELSAKSVWEFAKWLEDLVHKYASRAHESKLDEGVMGVKEAFDELRSRVTYLKKIGLGYLTIDRQTRTLSGGEQQRINMARCLGSALTSTMYCLDEPTAGLHARDSANLLDVLYELRDQGNTVVVVEHEKTVIDGADYLVEIGPGSGHTGGNLTFAGYPRALAAPEKISWEAYRKKRAIKDWIEVKGVRTHNLQNVAVRFPVGGFSVVCGVSGSGKTSLIQHSVYPMLAKELGSPIEGYVDDCLADSIGPKSAINKHSQIVHVSQGSLGRSSRSNIATYLGVYEEVRKVLADTPQAQALNLKPSHFSFNTSGGRCENCRGLGTIVEDLSFLGEMEVTCPVCEGKRFKDKILGVEYRGKNLSDILKMTVAEMAELFYDIKPIRKALQHVIDMGLSYVTVGQNTSSFSGGEAQRLKLLRLLNKTQAEKPSILIFDEPTTGLSDRDVVKLLQQLSSLCDEGHTVIVIEHHLGVIRACDWVIDVGPDAADRGGQIVFQGPPADLKAIKASMTAKYL